MRTNPGLKMMAGVAFLAAATIASAQERRGSQGVQQALRAAKITLAQAIETVQKEVAGGKVIEAGLESERGSSVYEVVVLSGAAVKEVRVDAGSGKVLGVKEEKPDADEEKELADAQKALGAAKQNFAQALEAAAKGVKDGKVIAIELEMKAGQPTHDVVLLQGDKIMKAALDAVSGKVLKVAEWKAKGEKKGTCEEGEEDGEEEEYERRAAKAAPQRESADGGVFRQEFKVDRTNWVDHGSNLYFILEPGYGWRYQHGAVVLTITVLDETKVVDGVTTRVLEEREEKDGKPLEVSRNYFAIDKSTNDVYYFGEDVDEYEHGKVVKHAGAWIAGVKDARFGLFMPGKPKVGDKFYQEIAPQIALDRAEIVSLDEKVVTPAGTFENCLHVKETTPLEEGVSHKYYAPGVGLVKDDGLALERVEKPAN